MLNISCLHTIDGNIAVFEAARRALKLDHVMLRHRVRADLLAAAEQAGGLTPQIIEQTIAELRAVSSGAHALLLTCSTLGPAVKAARNLPVPLVRTDQALADEAVAQGGSIVVLCAVATTIGPTRALFEQAAIATGATVEVRVVPRAWNAHKAGDEQLYWQLVADAADVASHDGLVALAQASMAGAARLVKGPAPLTSPASGLAAAVAAAEALQQPA